MDRATINIGPIRIYWYSICILLGMISAITIIYREWKKQGREEEILINLIFSTIVFGIIGARVYYVLFNLPYYINNPIEIIQVWNGGLAIHGGLITGLIVTYYYCKKYSIKFLEVLDIILVGVIIAQAIGRWGNFFNGEAYGRVTTLKHLKELRIPIFIINGMYISGSYREPAFLYESIWCIIGFLVMNIIKRYKNLKTGQLTGFYLIWYGTIRFIIEKMRSDSLMLGPIKMAQLVSLIFIVIGIIIIIKRISHKKNIEE